MLRTMKDYYLLPDTYLIFELKVSLLLSPGCWSKMRHKTLSYSRHGNQHVLHVSISSSRPSIHGVDPDGCCAHTKFATQPRNLQPISSWASLLGCRQTCTVCPSKGGIIFIMLYSIHSSSAQEGDSMLIFWSSSSRKHPWKDSPEPKSSPCLCSQDVQKPKRLIEKIVLTLNSQEEGLQ